jgi:hypothetical protein
MTATTAASGTHHTAAETESRCSRSRSQIGTCRRWGDALREPHPSRPIFALAFHLPGAATWRPLRRGDPRGKLSDQASVRSTTKRQRRKQFTQLRQLATAGRLARERSARDLTLSHGRLKSEVEHRRTCDTHRSAPWGWRGAPQGEFTLIHTQTACSQRGVADGGSKFCRRLSLFMLLGALVLAGCGSSAHRTQTRILTVTAGQIAGRSATTPSDPLASLVAKSQSGVIRIETNACGVQEIGTGFLIGPRMIATVQHVVDGASSITLEQGNKIVAEERSSARTRPVMLHWCGRRSRSPARSSAGHPRGGARRLGRRPGVPTRAAVHGHPGIGQWPGTHDPDQRDQPPADGAD